MNQSACPQCGKPALRRSARNKSDRTAYNLFMSPYRCDACGHRLWKMSSRFKYRVALAVLVVFISLATGGLLSQVSSSGPVQSPELVPQSTEKTLLPLAKKGNADAAYQLAMAYKEGRGVIENSVEAAKWFRKAAEQGHADAQFNLGFSYRAGRGSLQNFSEAVKWFEKAALQNNANGQYHLGLMYKAGQGIPPDNGKAYFWFNLAAAQAHQRAAEARDMVMLAMTPAQVSEAQRESNAWVPPAKASSQAGDTARIDHNSVGAATPKEPFERRKAFPAEGP